MCRLAARLEAGAATAAEQQLAGANYFFYYGATIFKAVGLHDSFVTQLILGAVNFLYIRWDVRPGKSE